MNNSFISTISELQIQLDLFLELSVSLSLNKIQVDKLFIGIMYSQSKFKIPFERFQIAIEEIVKYNKCIEFQLFTHESKILLYEQSKTQSLNEVFIFYLYIYQFIDRITEINQIALQEQTIELQKQEQKFKQKNEANFQQTLFSQQKIQDLEEVCYLLQFNEHQQCKICLEKQQTDTSQVVEQCGHIFHTECLINYLEIKMKEKSFPLICPQDACNQVINLQDIKKTQNANLFDQFNQKSLGHYIDTHADEISYCPTADCAYAFIYQGEKDFTCPKCTKHYCLNCRVEYHEKQTCEEYKIIQGYDIQDRKFIEFAIGAKMKQCPKCKFWVEKNKGCNHMTCRCKYQFCYQCGGVYGKCTCPLYDEYSFQDRQQRNQVIQQFPFDHAFDLPKQNDQFQYGILDGRKQKQQFQNKQQQINERNQLLSQQNSEIFQNNAESELFNEEFQLQNPLQFSNEQFSIEQFQNEQDPNNYFQPKIQLNQQKYEQNQRNFKESDQEKLSIKKSTNEIKKIQKVDLKRQRIKKIIILNNIDSAQQEIQQVQQSQPEQQEQNQEYWYP